MAGEAGRVGDAAERTPPDRSLTLASTLPLQGRDKKDSRDLAMRSVESRRSHRLSMREDEMLIAVTPFENPCAERAAAVAHEIDGEARSYFFVIPGRGR